MSETRVPIGVRIGVIREHRGMTQTELAKRAGTSQGAISMIESGERSPSWDMAERLADALGARLSFALASHEEREGEDHERILRLRALLLDVRGALYPAGYRQDGTEFGDGEGGGTAMLARKLVRWINTGIENDDRYPLRSHTDREPEPKWWVLFDELGDLLAVGTRLDMEERMEGKDGCTLHPVGPPVQPPEES